MKRIAILMAIACLALPVTAGAQDHGHRDGGRGESHDRGGGDERRGGDRDRSDRGGGDRGGGYRDERGYRGGPGPGYGDPGPRGGNYGSRGYGGGAPRSYRFVRGQQLPPEYRGYVVGDYERYHLRRPPRGYYWDRAGDDFVLAALASGLIFEVINAEGY